MIGQGEFNRKKLAWGCRRGMLELDIILANLAESMESLPEDELPAVNELLELDDAELWDLLILRLHRPVSSISCLVERLIFIPRI